MENNSKQITFGIIIGVSLVLSAFIVANTFYNVKALENSLAVTGLAKKNVTSDMAKWSGSFSRTITMDAMKDGYAQMAKDLAVVNKFFKSNGVDEKSVTISPVFMDKDYSYNNTGNEPQKYVLRQDVQLQLSDVAKVTDIAKKASDLASGDVLFSANSPEYYFTKLDDVRLELMASAVKDAQTRADVIAKSGGKSVASMTSAAAGVTQVLPLNSVDVSDYGTYDTTTVEKEVMMTVHASFGLK